MHRGQVLRSVIIGAPAVCTGVAVVQFLDFIVDSERSNVGRRWSPNPY